MKFREYQTSSEKLVLLGKSDENNEKLIEQVDVNEYVLHTKEPGSPFTNIKADKKQVTKKDLEEAALFCAKHSQIWRDIKKEVIVHVFLGKDIYKDKKMKLGTFGIQKIEKEIKVSKEDIKKFEKENDKK